MHESHRIEHAENIVKRADLLHEDVEETKIWKNFHFLPPPIQF